MSETVDIYSAARLDICTAAKNGDTAALARLIRDGSDRNYALYIASACGKAEVARWLLDAGADANTVFRTTEVIDRDAYDETMTCLRVAARSGYADVVRLLLSAGADPSAAGIFSNSTAVYEAARGCHPAVMRLLLDAGAAPDVRDSYNQATALDEAVFRGSVEILRMLLDHGAEAHFRNMNFRWPDVQHSAEIVSLLLQHGADPNEIAIWKRPILLWAADNASAEAVELLIRAGADVNTVTPQHGRPQGITALEAAREAGRTDVVRLLERAGARR